MDPAKLAAVVLGNFCTPIPKTKVEWPSHSPGPRGILGQSKFSSSIVDPTAGPGIGRQSPRFPHHQGTEDLREESVPCGEV